MILMLSYRPNGSHSAQLDGSLISQRVSARSAKSGQRTFEVFKKPQLRTSFGAAT